MSSALIKFLPHFWDLADLCAYNWSVYIPGIHLRTARLLLAFSWRLAWFPATTAEEEAVALLQDSRAAGLSPSAGYCHSHWCNCSGRISISYFGIHRRLSSRYEMGSWHLYFCECMETRSLLVVSQFFAWYSFAFSLMIGGYGFGFGYGDDWYLFWFSLWETFAFLASLMVLIGYVLCCVSQIL